MAKLLIISTVAATQRGFLLPFANHFRANGWRVDGMATGISNCEECLEAYDLVFENSWSRNPVDPKNFNDAVSRVRQTVNEVGYDIVHVHTPVASFVTRYALRVLRHKRHKGTPRVIYTAHGFHFHRGGHRLKNAVFLMLEKIAGPWTDYLVVINREDEGAAKLFRIVPPGRVRYMPGIGIDLEQYRPDAVLPQEVEQIREELGLGESQALFLMVAGFDPGKRHRDALRALAMLREPRVVLAFAGTGPLLESMKQLAHTLGVAGQVRFLGFRQDIPVLMKASLATLLPSEREGLPRSVMESMALGVPVIGADARGTRDLLASGAGIIVPVGDAEALARAMRYLLDNPEEAHKMGERGLEAIRSYDLRHILKMHEKLYAEALEGV